MRQEGGGGPDGKEEAEEGGREGETADGVREGEPYGKHGQEGMLKEGEEEGEEGGLEEEEWGRR